jgi:hypothetical protein
VSFCEGRADSEGDDYIVGVLGGAGESLAGLSIVQLQYWVAHMVDRPLVEGEIWATMDLRRSVILIM